jgi:polysaccharide export outer membrane protein
LIYRLIIPFFFFIASLFTACVPNKDLVYLQEKSNSRPAQSAIQEYQAQFSAYRVQHGDILNIKVMSQDPLSVAPFNIDGGSGMAQFQVSIPLLYISGYTVDENGNIEFPLVGSLEVKGKTIAEIGALLSSKIEKYVTNATVKVKLVSYKVTLLGEVRNPGVYYIYNDRASIFEVLGHAGDLSDLANRHNVKLMRIVGSQVQMSNLDLTDRKLIESKSFFLLPNDVIYVEPMRAKNFRLNLPTINLILSSLTTILVIYNIVRQ